MKPRSFLCLLLALVLILSFTACKKQDDADGKKEEQKENEKDDEKEDESEEENNKEDKEQKEMERDVQNIILSVYFDQLSFSFVEQMFIVG